MTKSTEMPTTGLPRRMALGLLGGAMVAPALSLSFLSGKASAAAAPRGGVLKLVMPASPASLDPLTGGQDLEIKFLTPIFDTLIGWDPATLTATPQLATDWHYPDPKTLVINLRKGVTFHDGTPFDAQAVKAHLERATGPSSAVRSDLASIDTVEAPSDSQVVLHLKQPDAALPLTLSDRAGMVSSPQAVKNGGDAYKRNPVGTGPWKFTNWAENEVVSVRRYDGYWGAPVALDGIDLKIISDPNTAMNSVIAGENDFAHRLFPQQKLIADRAKRTVQVNAPTMAAYQVVFNLSRPALQDERVRQAINFAVDRDAFNKASQLGLGTVASTLLPSGYWAHDGSLDHFYTHDPVKARALLAEAGHADGIDLQLYSYIDQAAQQRSELLIEQLREAGIRVKLVAGLNSDINPRFFIKGEGDLCLTLWSGRPDPAQTFQVMYSKEGFINPGHVAPPAEVQQALLDVRAIDDQGQRKAAFAKLERAVLENALSVSLFFAPEIDILASNVKGYTANVLGRPKFNEVYLEA
jgi:ABC-type transport system substrate-binding protein